jgi:hypothetical protein
VKLEARQPGQLDIKDQKASVLQRTRRQEFLRGGKPPVGQCGRTTKPPDSLSHGRVIIDDGDLATVHDHAAQHDGPARIAELSLGAE